MIVQACLNGPRTLGFHAQLPLTAEAISRDAAACVAKGAAELHVHPRDSDGRESLSAVDATILAIRRSCPGTLVGVSTGAWIEKNEEQTRAAILGWRELPDYASVNLMEADAPAIMELLRFRGIGIEAGLASAADAGRFLSLRNHDRVFRVLVEIEEQDFSTAEQLATRILAMLDTAGIRRPVLLHGFDATVWLFVELARRGRYSVRVGLEDGKHLPDGTIASDNAALVAAAVAELHRS